MAKKRRIALSPASKAVIPERAARLYRLLKLLSTGPHTRSVLTRRLGLDVRGFYRDLELLREAGIQVALARRRYTLKDKVADAVARLPFPDPHLTLGEATQLAKGRGQVHRKIKQLVARIIS
jgi:predicted DNA-binding transcriptional regulator YafY